MNKFSDDISNRTVLPEPQVLCRTALFRRQAESMSQWRQRVEGLKTGHVLQISGISTVLLANRPFSEAVDRNENFVVNAFLNSPDADVLKAVLAEKSWTGLKEVENNFSGNDGRMTTEFVFAQLHMANDQIMKATAEIETLWRIRHEGLKKKLREIRRTYIHWSLQIASILFVNCLPGKIFKDRLEDTPLNEFISSPLYNQFDSTFPALTEAVELAGVQDRKLYDAADEIFRLVMFSQWDKAYLLYRKVFPPATNALCAHLDQLIHLEKSIGEAQVRAINLFSERIAPASEIVVDSLDILIRMLIEKSEKNGFPSPEPVTDRIPEN